MKIRARDDFNPNRWKYISLFFFFVPSSPVTKFSTMMLFNLCRARPSGIRRQFLLKVSQLVSAGVHSRNIRSWILNSDYTCLLAYVSPVWIRPTVNLGSDGSILTSSLACIQRNTTTRSSYTLFIDLPLILLTAILSLPLLAIAICKRMSKVKALIHIRVRSHNACWRFEEGVHYCGMTKLTCGHRLSICVAAIRTNFTPSSLLEMEQARLATCMKRAKKRRRSVTWEA